MAVKDRRNALRNPYAHLRIPGIDQRMVESTPMLWEPIRYLDTCPSSDGACAMVLAAEDRLTGSTPPGSSARRRAPSRSSARAATP